jgi:hypothetical protein
MTMDDNTQNEAPRWRRFQCPAVSLADIPPAVIARFLKRWPIGQPDACWIWGRHPTNYGVIQWRDGAGKLCSIAAHRLAWLVGNRKTIPANTLVLHGCDVPPCCNPAHLRLGTHADNQRDAVRRGRWTYTPPTRPRTYCDAPAKPGTVGR